jgi:hypothetical protein
MVRVNLNENVDMNKRRCLIPKKKFVISHSRLLLLLIVSPTIDSKAFLFWVFSFFLFSVSCTKLLENGNLVIHWSMMNDEHDRNLHEYRTQSKRNVFFSFLLSRKSFRKMLFMIEKYVQPNRSTHSLKFFRQGIKHIK